MSFATKLTDEALVTVALEEPRHGSFRSTQRVDSIRVELLRRLTRGDAAVAKLREVHAALGEAIGGLG